MSTPENNSRIDYIEFAARDLIAAKKFYTAAFNWQFTDYGPDYTSFHDGRLAGGFFTSADAPAVSPSNVTIVIFGADLEKTEAAVIKAGGKITKPAFDFPGGRRFHFADPNGLELAVWSDKRADGSKIE
jgi:predicted enzyme related to lactoylglutathione lyase